MLTTTQITEISDNPRLYRAVLDTIHAFRKDPEGLHIYRPGDRPGDFDIYLDGVKLKNVFYVDTKLGLVKRYLVPLTTEADGETLKSETIYGKVHVQQRIQYD